MQPWRDAWEAALYGPDGFFVRERPLDHFRTSVAVPPFAEAVRRLASLVDEALGRPDPFDLVDLGAGRGELLAAVSALGVPARWRLTSVDLAPGMASELPPVHGLLLANEWLDDVPLTVLFDGQVVLVDASGAESLGGPASAEDLAWTGTWWPTGRRVEVGLSRDLAWQAAVRQVSRGLAVAADYGHVLGERRPTLTGYLSGRPVHAVPDGRCDLTAHVAVDSAAALTGASVVGQREALLHLGVDPVPPPRSLADTDPRGYLARLAAATQAAELVDPRGLGAFRWLVKPVGIDDPLAGLVAPVVAGRTWT